MLQQKILLQLNEHFNLFQNKNKNALVFIYTEDELVLFSNQKNIGTFLFKYFRFSGPVKCINNKIEDFNQLVDNDIFSKQKHFLTDWLSYFFENRIIEIKEDKPLLMQKKAARQLPDLSNLHPTYRWDEHENESEAEIKMSKEEFEDALNDFMNLDN